MRGPEDNHQSDIYSYIPLETQIPAKHPLRKIREIVDSVLESMSKDFDTLYSHTGRPNVPSETLLKALFLQVLYGIRRERLLLEQIDFNFLYRWFVGLRADDKIWDDTVFTKNRQRLLNGEIADQFFEKVIALANKKDLISDEHFTVDGTLIEAWASLKSFQKKDKNDKRKDDGDPGNHSVDFHGEKRSNATIAGYYAEHDVAIEMIDELKTKKQKTLGADKHYDNDDFCAELRERNVTPHVAMNIHARKHKSAIDGRTTRHPRYEVSQRKRKRVEEIFGWLKAFSIMRRPHFKGLDRIEYLFKFSVAAYNVLRIRNLLEAHT